MKFLQAAAPRVLTLAELAEYLHVCRATIYSLLKRNELPAFRLGRAWRFSVEQIDRWCAERESRTELVDRTARPE